MHEDEIPIFYTILEVAPFAVHPYLELLILLVVYNCQWFHSWEFVRNLANIMCRMHYFAVITIVT